MEKTSSFCPELIQYEKLSKDFKQIRLDFLERLGITVPTSEQGKTSVLI